MQQSAIDLISEAANNSNWQASATSAELREAVGQAMQALDAGQIRVAEPSTDGGWQVNAWVKQAVLLYFRLHADQVISDAKTQYYDRVPLKFSNYTAEDWQQQQIRVVPPACARFGCYIAPKCVLMPSYINIGAYVDEGCMIDTWATVGTCAQIGKRVHLSGGAGIGGVLEPLQANPTIIEDDCFIGARSEIVEGVVIERGAVISMGVFIGQSTPIYDRETGEISYGRVPANAVVIPGGLPSKDGCYSRSAAIIVKRADAKTRSKVELNQILREAGQ